MSGVECNYQRMVSAEAVEVALDVTDCAHCGISTGELTHRGETLELCAVEFCSDIATGERELEPVLLCPSCHEAHHLDAHRQHNPCQIKARLSREGLV